MGPWRIDGHLPVGSRARLPWMQPQDVDHKPGLATAGTLDTRFLWKEEWQDCSRSTQLGKARWRGQERLMPRRRCDLTAVGWIGGNRHLSFPFSLKATRVSYMYRRLTARWLRSCTYSPAYNQYLRSSEVLTLSPGTRLGLRWATRAFALLRTPSFPPLSA